MTRIKKLPLDDWDAELRTMTRADEGTPLEQGLMRIFAHCPEPAKGLALFAGSLKMGRTLLQALLHAFRKEILAPPLFGTGNLLGGLQAIAKFLHTKITSV